MSGCKWLGHPCSYTASARSLNSSQTRNTGYLHTELKNKRESDIASAIENVLTENGYSVKLDRKNLDRFYETAGDTYSVAELTKLLKQVSDGCLIIISINSTPPSAIIRNEMYFFKGGNDTGGALWFPVFDVTPSKDEDWGKYQYVTGGHAPSTAADELLLRIENRIEEWKARVLERAQVQEKLEENVADYVEDALVDLRKQEHRDRRMSYWCYVAGYIALLLGLLFASLGVREVSLIPQSEWIKFCVVGLKTLVIIAVVFACSRYTFNLGSSFMNEALRSSNRIHAIRFGKFYLQAFGDKAEWEQLKEVFQNWNIDRTSPFASMSADSYDPKMFEKLIDLAKASLEKGKS